MKTMKRFALVTAACWISTAANAAYLIEAKELNGNVVFSGSGSINLAGLTLLGGIGFPEAASIPSLGTFYTGPFAAAEFYSGISGPVSFSSGPNALSAFGTSITSGPPVGIVGNLGHIILPANYSSGSVLSPSIATFENSDLHTMGLAAGNYVWSWGQGASADTLTLQIGDVSAVPEPATWGLMLLGIGFIGAAMRRRQSIRVNLRPA